MPRPGAAIVLLAASGGCTIEAGIGAETHDYQTVARVPATFRHAVDLLFVVDNTEGMAGLQGEARRYWARLRDHLAHAEGGFPEVRIGVVSTDLGVAGDRDAAVPGCTGWGDDGGFLHPAGGEPFLIVDDGSQLDADVAVAQRLAIGEGGCRFGQPLAAMSRSLSRGDFVREGSVLAVVFVSGGDDCSVAPGGDFFHAGVTEYACFDRGVRCDGELAGSQTGCRPSGDPGMVGVEAARRNLLSWKDRDAVVVAGVFGDPERVEVVAGRDGLALAPACAAPGSGTLDPGVRIGAFIEAGGGSPAGVCDRSLDEAAGPTGYDLRDALGHRCLAGPIADVEPGQPGRQVECDVVAIDPHNQRHPIDACPNPNRVFEADGPCYAIKTGVADCADFETQLAVQLNWGELAPGPDPMVQPAGWTVEVGCVVETETPPLE